MNNKQRLAVFLSIIVIGFMIGFGLGYADKPVVIPHKCIDKTHKLCDGKCECDGLGCNTE